LGIEVIGPIRDVETIAVGASIRELRRLCRIHGRARWRKRKGVALVQLPSEVVALAELHWYEAHGIGRRGIKIKRLLDLPP
jgi:hypothetical protein